MNALGIPTIRSLSIISLPNIPVSRERLETAAVVARVSPTFLRIGSFEALNPPEGTIIYLFSANAQQRKEQDWEALRILGEWVARHVLKIKDAPDAPWGLKLVIEVARRNAIMVAGWQAYGFMARGIILGIHIAYLKTLFS